MTVTLATFLLALAMVESNCNDDAIGKHGEVGRYQIRQIYLDDVNRFLRTNFTIEDMKYEEKARLVVVAYTMHYSFLYETKTGNRMTFEVMARIHNGGPYGYKKDCTKAYWLKVKSAMERIAEKQ